MQKHQPDGPVSYTVPWYWASSGDKRFTLHSPVKLPRGSTRPEKERKSKAWLSWLLLSFNRSLPDFNSVITLWIQWVRNWDRTQGGTACLCLGIWGLSCKHSRVRDDLTASGWNHPEALLILCQEVDVAVHLSWGCWLVSLACSLSNLSLSSQASRLELAAQHSRYWEVVLACLN